MIDYLNVELLFNNPGSAVVCIAEEEAKQFVEYVQRKHPDKCPHWLRGETFFEKGGIAYTFYWENDNNEWIRDDLMYSKPSFVINNGYTILNLHDLLYEEEIKESDISLEMLFCL